MPAVGRKQKPAGQAVTRHQGLEWTEVVNTPFAGGPKLSKRPNGKPWPDGIVRRWHAYSTMPHCVLWGEADWEFAVDTLVMAARYFEGADPRMAAELRNREKVMGTTMDFRRDIRVRYIDPPAAGLTVAKLDDYRDL